LVFNAVCWFRRSVLWSTTCPALEVVYRCVYGDLRAGSLAPFHLPFLWSKFRVPPATSTVPARLQFAVCFFFHFCRAVHFWMLLCGPGDHLCDPLPALLQGVVYHPPALSPCCLSCLFFTENLVLSLTPCPPLFSSAGSECHPPPLLSVLYYSSLHIFQFCWRGIRLHRGVPQGVHFSSLCSANWHAGRFRASGSGSSEKWHQMFSVQSGIGKTSRS
jgi:hypothetical protein